MPDPGRVLELAKRGLCSRSELYADIVAMAEAQRQPGQSSAQAFARFVTTPEGSELFQIQKSLPGGDVDATSPVTKSVPTSNWDTLIRAVMKSGNVSYSTAVDTVLASENGRLLFQMEKRDQRVSSGAFSAADLQCLAGSEVEAQAAHYDLHKRSEPQHPYEDEVDKVRQMFPGLSESQIHDEARKRKPEDWESYKMRKLGDVALPPPRHQVQQAGDEHPRAATSGRKQPSHAAQWESEETHSTPTTPEHPAEHPDEMPKIKAARALGRMAAEVIRKQARRGASREGLERVAQLVSQIIADAC